MSVWNENDFNMLYVKVEQIEYKPDHPTAVIELGIDYRDIEKLSRFANRHLGTWVHLDFDEHRAMTFTGQPEQVMRDE